MVIRVVAVVVGIASAMVAGPGCAAEPERIRCDDLPCLDGTCAGTLVASGHAERLRTDATRLYWADGGDPARTGDERVRSMPLAGGAIDDLAAGAAFTTALRVSGGTVAWSTTAGIRAVTPPAASALVSDLGAEYGFDLDGAAVYQGTTSPGGLVRTTVVDRMVTRLAEAPPALAVVVHQGDVYFSTCSGVSRVATTGGAVEPLTTDECAIWLAVNDSALFRWSFSEDDGYGVRRRDLATGADERLLLGPERDGDVIALEADDRDVYFATEAAICRLPVAGGEAVKVADGTAFTVGADAIYWATAAGEIFRRAR